MILMGPATWEKLVAFRVIDTDRAHFRVFVGGCLGGCSIGSVAWARDLRGGSWVLKGSQTSTSG